MELQFQAKLWIYPGPAAWHFVTLPQNISKKIQVFFGKSPRGFGSFRVTVTVGQSSWQTSIFPDKSSGSFLLPIKSEIRKKEKLENGKINTYFIKINY